MIKNTLKKISKIIQNGPNNIHIVSDFDGTLSLTNSW